MTSGFKSLVDTLRTAIPTLTGFTAKTELPNAYNLEDCGQQFRTDGWGLTFGSAKEVNVEFSGTLCNEHSFSVVLAREVLSTRGSADAMITSIEALKDDALTLQREILAADKMGLGSNIELILYTSTSAVVFGNQDQNNWITTTVNFSAAVRESI